ncbi:dynein axonemal intermediate chain 4 [Nothobranchius furzeri]|uniref:Dynein axonemal intermediate chain 4 n=1 Tax=Nothobranchius furzeri TaxID=105023 RepID=A0A1A8A012_NOTFU|nr:dynein axonemal intermediate chain 4 [Nothobranchius furzeri]KAF7223108.1 WD repeat domain 78 [Nothobranchius furzeri]
MSEVRDNSGRRPTMVQGRSRSRRTSLLASPSRRSLSLGSVRTSRPAVQLLDEEGNDVTPQPLYQVDPAAAPLKVSRFLVDQLSFGSVSDHTTVSGSFLRFGSVFGSSRMSSHSTIEEMNKETGEAFSKGNALLAIADETAMKNMLDEEVTEAMLDEKIEILLTESETISLLDIPSTVASADETVMEKHSRYAEVCSSRMTSETYVDQPVQTQNGATKNKPVQSEAPLRVDAATSFSILDLSDAPELEQTVDISKAKGKDSVVAGLDSGTERSGSLISSTSTGCASSSQKEVDKFGTILNAQSDLQLTTMSEAFQNTLLVMERNILSSSVQHGLVPLREDRLAELPPSLTCLSVFSCELSRGRSISSMAWNKKNPDLLAVGHGEPDSRNQKAGLVCCWSLNNPTRPERIIHCNSVVTCLDFSACSPSQLAVGMCDGTIAVYDVQSPDAKSQVISSCECPNRHLGPVWQLRWIQQELSYTEEKAEALFSLGEDGRMRRWSILKGVFDCADVMKLKRINHKKKKDGKNETGKATESVLSALIPGLCFDFHPTDSSIYLIGTWEGVIHKCSCSNRQQFLEMYKKHFAPVNSISWCPLNPDLFLSCSADWTIQLWKHDCLKPVLGFTTTCGGVHDIKWSPKAATVFGAVKKGQLEIWNLDSSFLDPIIVQPAAPGVTMTSLLFASHTDYVVVGDAEGQVTVFLLNNLSNGQPGNTRAGSTNASCPGNA